MTNRTLFFIILLIMVFLTGFSLIINNIVLTTIVALFSIVLISLMFMQNEDTTYELGQNKQILSKLLINNACMNMAFIELSEITQENYLEKFENSEKWLDKRKEITDTIRNLHKTKLTKKEIDDLYNEALLTVHKIYNKEIKPEKN